MRKTVVLLVPAILIALLLKVLSTPGAPLPELHPGAAVDTAGSPNETLRGSLQRETREVAQTERNEVPPPEPGSPLHYAILSGVAIDEDGSPVADVPLSLIRPETGMPGASIRTKDDGSFLFQARRPSSSRTRIRVKPESMTAFRILSEDRLFEWGTDGIEIVVSRPQTWILNVVEAGAGVPVEEFDWRCTPLSTSSYQRRMGWGEHEGGHAAMTRLEYGKHSLVVFPEDQDLVPSLPVEFEVGPGSGEIRVELQRRRPLTVRVQRGDGTPVSGTEVQLLRHVGRGELRLGSSTGPADINFYGYVQGTILDEGETNAWGEVVLRGPRGEDLAVKVLGPGHAPEFVSNVSIADNDSPLVIRVLTGATLTGTFRPMSVLESIRANLSERERERDRYQWGLALTNESGGSRFPIDRDDIVAIQPDGSFRIEEVPAGNWEVHLSYWDSLGGLSYRQSHSLVSIRDLKEGESRRITLDASALVPGRVTGRIYLDGEPYADNSFGLLRSDTNRLDGMHSYERRSGFVTDGEGRFSVEIPGGWVSAFIPPEQRSVGLPIDSTELLQVSPGQAAVGVFHLVHRRMQVRFLEHDGTPATERYFTLHRDGRTIGLVELRTDGEGWLIVDPAPDYPIGFYTWPRGMDQTMAMQLSQEKRNQMRIGVGPVQIPTGTREAEFTLRLPEDVR